MTESIKSAVRVIRILEYFDVVRGEATVTEISRALGYPASSTVGLLRSLVDVGYLVQGERRSYRPTPRVTLLGNWVEPLLAPGGPVVALMEELGRVTGETVALGMPSGLDIRYIFVVPATKPMRLHVAKGDTRPMVTSGVGRMFMSTMADAEVRRLIFRHNALYGENPLHSSTEAVFADLEHIRRVGYSVSLDRIVEGAGIVCMPLPLHSDTGPLAISIAGLSSTIRSTAGALAAQIHGAIERHLPAIRPVAAEPRQGAT